MPLKIRSNKSFRRADTLVKGDHGMWSWQTESESYKANVENSHTSFPEAVPRYVTAFDAAFTKATEC